jgi:hypothetical protein
MKRSITAIGVGLSVLIAGSGALVLFPRAAGAHPIHAVAGNRSASTSRSQAGGVLSVLSASRRLDSAITASAAQQHQYRTGRATMRRLSYTSGSRHHGTMSYTTGTMRSMQYGTTYRSSMTYRSGTAYRYGMRATHTGHNCPGMTTSKTPGK